MRGLGNDLRMEMERDEGEKLIRKDPREREGGMEERPGGRKEVRED